MKEKHWDTVVDTFKALSYLVKKADPNGIDLVLTSKPDTGEKSGRNETKTLVGVLEAEKRQRSIAPCNMEISLAKVLTTVKKKLGVTPSRIKLLGRNNDVKGVNVYIFTDAVWEGGNDEACGVEEPIRDLIRFMRTDSRLGRTSVALQFIQFGDDDLAERRLAYLDDELGRELQLYVLPLSAQSFPPQKNHADNECMSIAIL